MKLSVIIPMYNEDKVINDCILSLAAQTYTPDEVIVIDDGSTDESTSKVLKLKKDITELTIILCEQKHTGSGAARNLGNKNAKGDILIFVDADMTFDSHFLEKLVVPIESGETRGTFTKDEFVANWENIWARCWNYNQGIKSKRRIPLDYPDEAPVFRAILRKEFIRVGGFDNIGFTDDWTISRKLGYKATAAKDAICYHKNPASLEEVYTQARWIGKNEFITGTLSRKIKNLIAYCPFVSLFSTLMLTLQYQELGMLAFKPVYDVAIWVSVSKSFFGEAKKK